MSEIIAILEALSPSLSTDTLKHLRLLIEATLSMTGRVTMLGISRWTEKGVSYRTVQRFFKETHNWTELRWLLIKIGSLVFKVDNNIIIKHRVI